MHEHAIDPREVAESELATRQAVYRAVAFRDPQDGHEHLALVLGEVDGAEDVPVRVHSECLTGDVFGALRCECGEQLQAALDTIVETGRGVVVYLRGHEGRGIGLLAKVRTHTLQDGLGLDTIDSATALNLPVDTRDYGPAARALRYLGVGSVRLMSNNPDKVAALTRFDIRVTGRMPVLVPAHTRNIGYLTAKRDRLGHDLPHLNGVPVPNAGNGEPTRNAGPRHG